MSLGKYIDKSSRRLEKWFSRMWDFGLIAWDWTLECLIGSSIGKGGASGVQIWDKGSGGEGKVKDGIH